MLPEVLSCDGSWLSLEVKLGCSCRFVCLLRGVIKQAALLQINTSCSDRCQSYRRRPSATATNLTYWNVAETIMADVEA